MIRDRDPRPVVLTRRGFLALASTAAGLALRPSWALAAAAGGERAAPPPLDREHALALEVPEFTGNGAKVPVRVVTAHPMTAEHHVTRIQIRNETDPISAKGTFHLTPRCGRAEVAFQARMHEGVSEVTAIAECNLHGSFSARRTIAIPAGAGGCSGAAPPIPRTSGDDVRGPLIRIHELVARGRVARGELVHVQVMMRHPNRTGLVLRDGRFVAESEPIHLDDMEVHYDGEPVCRFAATSALSDDPLIGFTLRAGSGGLLRVVLRNCRGDAFEGAQELRVS